MCVSPSLPEPVLCCWILRMPLNHFGQNSDALPCRCLYHTDAHHWLCMPFSHHSKESRCCRSSPPTCFEGLKKDQAVKTTWVKQWSKARLTEHLFFSWDMYPIGSMYGIFTYNSHKKLNAGKYTIHGSYGYCTGYDSQYLHVLHDLKILSWYVSLLFQPPASVSVSITQTIHLLIVTMSDVTPKRKFIYYINHISMYFTSIFHFFSWIYINNYQFKTSM